MDLHIITALWCKPHPLGFSSKITRTNVSCISVRFSCLLTPVCALKKTRIQSVTLTADSPLCCSYDTLSMSLARQRKTFLSSTYGNLSYHDGGETLLLDLDSPRAAALLQEQGMREQVSSSLFSLARTRMKSQL